MGNLLGRLLAGIYRRLGWDTLLTLALLLALALAATYGIGSTLKGIQPEALAPYVVGGLGAACLLHGLRLRGGLAGLVLVGGGGMGVFILIGRLGGFIQSLFMALASLRPSYTADVGWQMPVGELQSAWTSLGVAVYGVTERFSAWAGGLLGAGAVFDPLAAALMWSLCAWMLGAWLGWWALRRGLVLVGAAPLMGLFAWVAYYTQAQVILLIVALALVMALHILSLHFKHVQRWLAAHLDPPDNLGVLFLVLVLVIGGLSFTAWGATSEQMKRFEKGISEWLQPPEPLLPLSESAGEALGLQSQGQAQAVFGSARKPTLPSQHLLQGGVELSQTVVMRVTLEGEAADPQAEPPHYYWRSLVYNRYNGRGWYSDPTVTTTVPADALLSGSTPGKITLRSFERLVRQQFRINRYGGGVVYAAGELLMVDQEVQVAWRRSAASGDTLGAVVQQNTYRATSRTMEPGAQALRQAGSRYPDWVIARYTQLPDQMPQRVLDLALDLTAAEPTPYDRALALETYLRSTYTYTLDLPAPPIHRDLVDYFLFDLQQGYCDYYASAMVVLARASGVPARLVTGYAGGTWDVQARQFTVTEAEAHSWVEIYFPEIGWITFEPTASQPAPVRPDLPAVQPSETGEVVVVNPSSAWWDWLGRAGLAIRRAWVWGMFAAAGLIYLAVNVDRWRLGWRSPPQTVTMVYARIYIQALHLGVLPAPGGTLREFSQRLTHSLRQMASSTSMWENDLVCLAEDVHSLSALYEQVLFSPHALGQAEQRRCIRAWQRMRLRFWLARLRHRFGQVVDPAS